MCSDSLTMTGQSVITLVFWYFYQTSELIEALNTPGEVVTNKDCLTTN